MFDIRVSAVVSHLWNGGLQSLATEFSKTLKDCQADKSRWGGGAVSHLCTYYILHTSAIDQIRLDETLNSPDHEGKV